MGVNLIIDVQIKWVLSFYHKETKGYEGGGGGVVFKLNELQYEIKLSVLGGVGGW